MRLEGSAGVVVFQLREAATGTEMKDLPMGIMLAG
jgi:hypothetical protein